MAAYAGPPVNDLCADAIEVCPPVVAFDTTGAGTDGAPDPLCGAGGGNVFNDTWYTYEAAVSGQLTITATAGFGVHIAVYDGCGCADPLLACGPPPVMVSITAGSCYTVRVGGDMAGVGGAGQLMFSTNPPTGACCDGPFCLDVAGASACPPGGTYFGDGTACCDVSCTAAPANDNCEDRIPLPNGLTAFSTEGATTDGPPNPLCTGTNGSEQVHGDIWYNYQAAANGAVVIKVEGADFDTKLALYETCGCVAKLIACDPTTLCAPTSAGACYKVRTGSAEDGETGSGALRVTFLPDSPGAAAGPGSDPCDGIPTVGQWGAVVMTLLVLSAGTVVFGARRRTVASR